MQELEQARKELDEVDRMLVQCFEARMQISREIARIKRSHGLEVLDTGREQKVLESRAGMLQDPALQEAVKMLYQTIMALSRAEQQKIMEDSGCA